MTPYQLIAIVISIPLAAVLCAVLLSGFYVWAKDRGTSVRLMVLCAALGLVMGFVILGIAQVGYYAALSQGLVGDGIAVSVIYAVLYLLPSILVVAALYALRKINGLLSGALYGAAVAFGVTVFSNIYYLVPIAQNWQMGITDVIAFVIGYGAAFPFTFNLVQMVAGATVGFGFGAATRAANPGRRIAVIVGPMLLGFILMVGYLMMVNYIISVPVRILAALVFAFSGLGTITAITRSAQLGESLAETERARQRVEHLVQGVIPLGMALAEEKDFNRLLDRILGEAQTFANADGATLYLRTAQDAMDHIIVRNNSLNIRLGGSDEPSADFPVLPLERDGKPNLQHVVTNAVNTGQSVNVADAYGASTFDLTGPREFDAKNNYRTRSILCVPLKNATGQAIGAMQLINARDAITQQPIPFSDETQEIVESVSALAAAALVSYVRAETLRKQAGEFNIHVKVEERDKQVAEIVENDFFSALKGQVSELRMRKKDAIRRDEVATS